MFDFHSPTDETFLTLSVEEELSDAIRRSDEAPVMLFKHSATCPISSGAQQRLTTFLDTHEVPTLSLIHI